jgi:hypothetical protein
MKFSQNRKEKSRSLEEDAKNMRYVDGVEKVVLLGES